MANQLSTTFDLSQVVVGLQRDGKACLLQIDGYTRYTVGAPAIREPQPLQQASREEGTAERPTF
jgi:hypothetical protein